MEKMLIKGVAKDDSVARVALIGVPDEPGIAFKVFSRVAKAHICVDNILQSVGRDGTKDIAFTVPADDADAAADALREYSEMVGARELTVSKDVAKISIVGAGMETHENVAAGMFEALAVEDINIQTITSSEIRVSVLVDKKDADRAVAAVHRQFFGA
jgi:aspartate kinase